MISVMITTEIDKTRENGFKTNMNKSSCSKAIKATYTIQQSMEKLCKSIIFSEQTTATQFKEVQSFHNKIMKDQIYATKGQNERFKENDEGFKCHATIKTQSRYHRHRDKIPYSPNCNSTSILSTSGPQLYNPHSTDTQTQVLITNQNPPLKTVTSNNMA